MILPKITYGAGPTTLNFSYPPVMKPAVSAREAVRNDADSYAGQRQSVYFHTNIFWTLQLDFIPEADMAAWVTFMAWAETGAVFTYFPDATVSGTHMDYTLDDKKFDPARVAARAVPFNKVKLRFRQYVA